MNLRNLFIYKYLTSNYNKHISTIILRFLLHFTGLYCIGETESKSKF